MDGKIKKGQVRNPYGRAGKPKPTNDVRINSPRRDGWTNVSRGLGLGRDAKIGTQFVSGNLKSNLQYELEALYTQSWIGRKVVDIPIDDAMRNGVVIEHDNPEVVAKVEKRMKQLKIDSKISSLAKWARVYGSSVMVLVSGDDDIKNAPNIGINDISNFAILSPGTPLT